MTDTRTPRYGTVDTEYAQRLATTPPDEDGPVWMVNLMKYREVADYRGDADDGEASISGREADDKYTPLESLAGVGAEIVFVGDVDQQLLGDDPVWDRIAIVKYPTRRAFIEMQSRPDFQRQHVHKEAGMEQTFVIGCQPMEAPDWSGSASWDDVPYPPTDDDGAVQVLHVLKFEGDARGVTPDDMAEYQRHAGRIAGEHGVRIARWFQVEGTIVGDGRGWDQVRFNEFPSKRAFMEVVMDPDRLEAQRDHREVAIADTYTMIIRPTIDRLRES